MLNFNNSILLVDKPKGKSSFWVIKKIRELTGVNKVGHTGTLDPLATGILPVCLGEATKLSDILMSGIKTYRVRAKLGQRTDTLDADGILVAEKDFTHINVAGLEEVLSIFKGFILQTPPMYSAIKKEGVPLYKYARAGTCIERKAREVEVIDLKLLNLELPYFELSVTCSKGTYVRTLVDDIGDKLGSYAHVVELRREKTGIFNVENSIVVDHNTSATELSSALFSIEDIISKSMPTVLLPKEVSRAVAKGAQLTYEQLLEISAGVESLKEVLHLALLGHNDNGEEKLVAIINITTKDFNAKVTQTLRVFNYSDWMV